MPTHPKASPVAPRRRTGEHAPRVGGRSARVVDGVMRAALEELAQSGYGALRVDDVAARAGVNKTSIYRRWPTKVALVDAALRSHAGPEQAPPDTGSIEGDCLEALRQIAARASSTVGRALLRVAVIEGGDPELAALAGALRGELRARLEKMVRRAVRRGEVSSRVRAAVVVEALTVPVYARLRAGDEVDGRYLRELVALVLDGARPR